jgi:hypothetical protein
MTSSISSRFSKTIFGSNSRTFDYDRRKPRTHHDGTNASTEIVPQKAIPPRDRLLCRLGRRSDGTRSRFEFQAADRRPFVKFPLTAPECPHRQAFAAPFFMPDNDRSLVVGDAVSCSND